MVTRYMTKNPCYTAGRIIRVEKLMLHSIGVAQPEAEGLINQFNQPDYTRACVHGFIDADETYITMPCLETPGYAMRAPHAGKSAMNNRSIGIEMTEPAEIEYLYGATFRVLNRAKAVAHMEAVTRRAVDLFAELCIFHDLDPMEDILSHYEGALEGVASAHGDPDHMWRGLGMDYSMDHFRRDVAERMEEMTMDIEKMIEEMTDAQAYALLKKAQRHAATLPQQDWSKQEGHWDRAKETGLTDGNAPEGLVKRSEVMAWFGRKGLI